MYKSVFGHWKHCSACNKAGELCLIVFNCVKLCLIVFNCVYFVFDIHFSLRLHDFQLTVFGCIFPCRFHSKPEGKGVGMMDVGSITNPL